MTNAEAWFNIDLRPRKPEGSLGRTAQDGHLDSYTAPELYVRTELSRIGHMYMIRPDSGSTLAVMAKTKRRT